MNKKYEIMTIVSNELKSDDAKKFIKETVITRLEKSKANITFDDFWGERGFAYIIKKQKWGFYHVAQFETSPLELEEIKNDLNLEAKIIRFMISSVDKKAPSPRKYSEIKAEAEAQSNKKEVVDEKPITKGEKLTTVKTKEKAAPVQEKIAKTPAKEENKDAVDKKLDEILEDSSLNL